MAQVVSERVTVQFSKLVKNTDQQSFILDEESLIKIEEALQNYFGNDVIVELVGSE